MSGVYCALANHFDYDEDWRWRPTIVNYWKNDEKDFKDGANDDKTNHIEAGSAVEALPPPKACLSQVWKYFLLQKNSFSIKILTVRLESSESTTRLPDAWWTSVVFFVNFVVFKERSRCWYFCQLPTSHCYVVVDLAVSVLTSSQMALAIVNWQCCLLVLNFSGSRRWRKVGEEVRGRGGYWDEEDDEEEEDEGGEEEKEEEVQLEASRTGSTSSSRIGWVVGAARRQVEASEAGAATSKPHHHTKIGHPKIWQCLFASCIH